MPQCLSYGLLLQVIIFLSQTNAFGKSGSLQLYPIHKHDFDSVNLADLARYYHDSTGTLSAEQIREQTFLSAEEFPLRDERFFITRGNVWVKFGIINYTDDTLTCFNRLDWHSFIDQYDWEDPSQPLQKRGKMRAFHVKSVHDYGHFQVKIPPRDTLKLLYRFNNRLAKRNRKYMHILLFSEVGYYRFMENLDSKGFLKDQMNFFLIAFLFSVAFFTFFQYFQIKDATYLAYFSYVFLSMLYLFRDSGVIKIITPFFHQIPELVAYSGPFFTVATNLCYLVFLQLFLELKTTDPRLNKFLNVLAGVLIFSFVADVVFLAVTQEIKLHLFLFTLFRLLINLLSIGVLIRIILYGQGKLRYYIIAGLTGLMLGSIFNLGLGAINIYSSRQLNDSLSGTQIAILPDLALTIGIIFELVCFSLGLGYKTHLKTREKVKAEEELRIKEKEAEYLYRIQAIRNRFYTNITHEFRTPLTIIIGVAQQLRKGINSTWKEGASFTNHLDMIKRNGQQVLQLVNQMLDLSRLESGKIDLNYIQGDIINFLKYLTESFHSMAENRAIDLHFLSELDELYMDYDQGRLQQIFYNVLSNALKFTPEGGHVYVQVEHMEAENASFLCLKIKDTGIGIPEDQVKKIFERFYQADDGNTRHADGTGLGLALVKELVQLMEGTIDVKSKIGKGTTFMLKLPISQEADTQQVDLDSLSGPVEILDTPDPLSLSAHSNQVHSVLVIEDNEDVLQYISNCIGSYYRVQVARNGEEGIHQAQKRIPDLIICDVMMPIVDGYEVCETLKSDRRTCHIPILMLTAKVDRDSRLKGLKQGADRYLVKPFQEEELLQHLNNLVLQQERMRDHYLFLSGLSDTSSGLARKDDPDRLFIEKVKSVIQEHITDGSFTVSQMARELALSQSQLHRKLMALTGYSASKMIRMARLDHAKQLLQNPSLTIASVAYDSGFNDPDYLAKVFKHAFGMTPTEFRMREREEYRGSIEG